MKIYLFRHAEKSSHFHPNPGLSERGALQALRLAEKVMQSELPKPTQLWISPKKRTQESFTPLATQLNIQPQILSALDEKKGFESIEEFRDRISEVISNCASQNGILFICTHSDWIEEALTLIPSAEDLTQFFQWSPLQYLGLNLKKDCFEFIEHKRIPL